MECNYFGKCGSCTLYEMKYNEQVELKKQKLKELFEIEDFDLFLSPSSHYRSRAEFRIWHDEEGISYAMSGLEKKEVIKIDKCPKVIKKIYDIMEPLKIEIEKSNMLRERLFGIEFLASSSDMLISLLYHKKIDERWDGYAKELEKRLGVSIIGRSRKVKRVISKEFIKESIEINRGNFTQNNIQNFTYFIAENSFSQPNSFVNSKMISWALKHIEEPEDLLELYCGHGNFTIPLSFEFTKVLATEISKNSIKYAKINCDLNSVKNIEFLRMSALELTSALDKKREFRRLENIDLDSYNFSHVLVDPPRAGIDEESLEFISRFKNIIYISCNPTTLKRDLDILTKKFRIEKFAMFDQFPHTLHVECGVILTRFM